MDQHQSTDLLPRIITTRDQRKILLRAIEPGDEALLERFFGDLSPASRRMRFHGGVRTVSRQVLQRMVRWDPLRELALLAVGDGGAGPVCIGEARYAVAEGASDQREFALVVDDGWQGVGIGSVLLDRLTRHAKDHRVGRLVGDVLPDNKAMIGLARRLGYALRPHPDDARLRLLTRSLVEPHEVAMPWPALALPGGWAVAH